MGVTQIISGLHHVHITLSGATGRRLSDLVKSVPVHVDPDRVERLAR
jgi:hypothetical protein